MDGERIGPAKPLMCLRTKFRCLINEVMREQRALTRGQVLRQSARDKDQPVHARIQGFGLYSVAMDPRLRGHERSVVRTIASYFLSPPMPPPTLAPPPPTLPPALPADGFAFPPPCIFTLPLDCTLAPPRPVVLRTRLLL